MDTASSGLTQDYVMDYQWTTFWTTHPDGMQGTPPARAFKRGTYSGLTMQEQRLSRQERTPDLRLDLTLDSAGRHQRRQPLVTRPTLVT